ncbi:MAG: hypothetical protein ACLP5E_26400 [Streptosporangiaceae bacterium]
MDRLRIGTLGADHPGRAAQTRPRDPRRHGGRRRRRDPERARRFAAKHRIRRAHDSYQELIDDPAIDGHLPRTCPGAPEPHVSPEPRPGLYGAVPASALSFAM